jgi:hypothetical protein
MKGSGSEVIGGTSRCLHWEPEDNRVTSHEG